MQNNTIKILKMPKTTSASPQKKINCHSAPFTSPNCSEIPLPDETKWIPKLSIQK